jgi:hypothetical protein
MIAGDARETKGLVGVTEVLENSTSFAEILRANEEEIM